MLSFIERLLAAPTVGTALAIGSLVAVTSGVVGVFVVLRGQSFAGHALGDIGTTGAAAAYLTGVPVLYGFVGVGILGGLAIEGLGERARERDVATGIILSLMLGIGALLLYFMTQGTSATGGPVAILFGSIFTVDPSIAAPVALFSLLALLLLAFLYRPLVYASVNPQAAKAAGVPTSAVGLLFMLSSAIAVEESALVAGALLSTALLVGPASAAVRWSRHIGHAAALAALLGLLAVWLGIALAYQSYVWPPGHRGWPVSFFIVMLVLIEYLLARIGHSGRSRAAARKEAA